MALFDYAAREVLARIVYYGPPQAGKTTNLLHIHEKLPPPNKGELTTLTTETSRMLAFDFVTPDPGSVRGLRMRFQLCALVSPASSAAAQRALLKGADAVVFVADSQAEALEADAQSLESLYRNLVRNQVDLQVPMVMQFNKRDLATTLPLQTLGRRLNSRAVPAFEAIATRGIGVEETLRVITRLCFRAIAAWYGEAEGMPAASRTPTGPIRVPRPQPPPAEAEHGQTVQPSARHDTLPATRLDLPGAPAAPAPTRPEATPPRPPRVATQQSLARESLGSAPTRQWSRTATLPFTKLELLGQPPAEAKPAPEAPQVLGPGTAGEDET